MAKFSLAPTYESSLISSTNYSRIVGIDEVGRGCIAGPVTVGAYIFSSDEQLQSEVKDSKTVTEKKRKEIYKNVQESNKDSYYVEYATNDQIDQYGIAKCIEILIWKIIKKLDTEDTFFLIDGRFRSNFGENSKKVIDGDAIYYSIALASILAKVERDEKMTKYDKKYPEYGFYKHKGYGTKQHLDTLEQFGPSEIHRKSFKPVSNFY